MTLQQDDDVTAGEYVLGLLEGARKDAFEQAVERNRDLAEAVQRWQSRLAAIDQSAPQTPPAPGLWARIEAGLQAPRTAERVASPRSYALSHVLRWWNDLWLWRGAALAGLALAALFGGALVFSAARVPSQPVLVAVLMTDANVAAAVVNTFADGRAELIPLQNIAVPQGRALQIWTLWDRQAGPRSVGLIDRAQTVPLRLQDLPLGSDQLFEITLEPATGSPTGRPTGPIVAKGLTARSL